ncbi:PAS domain S-box protein [Altericista sp. CCNU0014]|uniref:PAS domain-containing sensor histidine kinase n=1 Tax=Altericista sp. CCNU0014 TaxID=3082949 RepID=UPI00384B9A7B
MTPYRKDKPEMGLERQIQGIQVRLNALRQNAESVSVPSRTLLEEAIADLNSTLEELQATAEELSQQNIELLATRQDLEAERQRYRTLFELAPDAYLVTDAKGIIQAANCASEILFQLHRDLLVGKLLVMFVPPAGRPLFRTQLERLTELVSQDSTQTAETGENDRGSCTTLVRHLSQDWEMQFQPRKGQTFSAALSICAKYEPDSRAISSIHWLIRDISDRKRAEETLKQSNQQLETRVTQRTGELSQVNTQLQLELSDRKRAQLALLQSEELFRNAFAFAVNGLALVGLDRHFLRVNPSLCRLLGYTETELLTMTSDQLIEDSEAERQRSELNQLVLGEVQSIQTERRYFHKLGYPLWIVASTSLVRDFQSEPLYFVKQMQDVTERRIAEQVKTDFIAIASHELRTPLASIRGSLGLLASGNLDTKAESSKQMLSVAALESERLVRLVDDILSLDRLEAQKLPLERQLCRAADLMNRATQSVQSLAEERNIAITLIPNEIEVWVDPDRIIQVLINLLNNAIKFSPPQSSVALGVQTQTEQVLFQVRDRGRGIPASKTEAIFGRFQQVDSSDTRQIGGTGLGLAICRTIVQQHGGHIWVESIEGEGSTFYFTLPIM